MSKSVAVHAFSDSISSERTNLVLADDGSVGENGLLQDRKIRDLHLSADLVTLSACDTRVGKLKGQEDISSLVHSFLLAGAKAVVASLWTADDTATTSLMKRFYLYLEHGEDKGSALRNSKLELIRQYGQYVLPYHLAGFTIHGETVASVNVIGQK